MKIRKASGNEMLALWGYQDVNSASPTARFFYKNINGGNAIFWTAEDDGKLIGELYVFLNLDDKDFADGTKTAYLCAFRVEENYRRQGIGTSLIETAVKELAERGFTGVTIGVDETEELNIKLYRRLGFNTKIKDCATDPCAMNKDMEPDSCDTFWLLYKDISGEENLDKVSLTIMTRELCHELYKSWENDDSIYMDMSLFKPYNYREEAVDRYYDSKQEPSRRLFAIMLEDKPIGEVQLKQIDQDKKECTLSIHMQNDAVKGKGYGTQAERLAIKYAFEELGMMAVNADTVVKNVRSQHILDKLGFWFIKEEGDFKYYRLERKDYEYTH
jgi:RimJ/RimL family protein N-acetyltransferase